MSHADRTVALAVSGSLAALRAVEVARALLAEDVRVLPVMTEAAARFVGPAALAGICGRPVATDSFDPAFGGEAPVVLARQADVVAVVPATAELLADMATGRGADLASALALCARGPVVVAPAMHERMWAHPATQRNVRTLLGDGRVTLVGPVEGRLPSGERTIGRMADPAEIARAILNAFGPTDLTGMRLVVTAGPTVEDLDPVRFLSNRSTGRMGFAIAERAAARGAEVTLIAGPVGLTTPASVRRVDVRGVASMQSCLDEELGPDLGGADALIMAAAVADYVPRDISPTKLKKSEDNLVLDLVRAPDLLKETSARRAGASLPVLVGFALETGSDADVAQYARGKLVAKNVDLIVANEASEALATQSNRATLVSSSGSQALEVMSKHQLADRILDRVRILYAERSGKSC